MVDTTYYNDRVPCHMCGKVDMENGLKKRNRHWYCKRCFASLDAACGIERCYICNEPRAAETMQTRNDAKYCAECVEKIDKGYEV